MFRVLGPRHEARPFHPCREASRALDKRLYPRNVLRAVSTIRSILGDKRFCTARGEIFEDFISYLCVEHVSVGICALTRGPARTREPLIFRSDISPESSSCYRNVQCTRMSWASLGSSKLPKSRSNYGWGRGGGGRAGGGNRLPLFFSQIVRLLTVVNVIEKSRPKTWRVWIQYI